MAHVHHRGILIQQADIPGSPYYWSSDDLNTGGQAETLARAKQQINRAIGTPPDDCPCCDGIGHEGPPWNLLCAVCWGTWE